MIEYTDLEIRYGMSKNGVLKSLNDKKTSWMYKNDLPQNYTSSLYPDQRITEIFGGNPPVILRGSKCAMLAGYKINNYAHHVTDRALGLLKITSFETWPNRIPIKIHDFFVEIQKNLILNIRKRFPNAYRFNPWDVISCKGTIIYGKPVLNDIEIDVKYIKTIYFLSVIYLETFKYEKNDRRRA